jgi:citronellol/citronellal dehydrogenase
MDTVDSRPRTGSLAGRTLFITGGSRGIGLAIALRAARDGANVTIAAKTSTPHAKLEGTIHSAAQAIEEAGGRALPIVLDVRDAAGIEAAVARTAAHFGGIDICINNASAIDLSSSLVIDTGRFDLIQQINMRGTFLVSRACVPHLRRSANPHILSLAPRLVMRPDWFAQHLPYTLSKYGMAMVMLGLAEELRGDGIACNALWPETMIATAAVRHVVGDDALIQRSRTPDIMAEAAHAILTRDARRFTGQFVLDRDILAEEGIIDLASFQVDPAAALEPDIFVDPGELGARRPAGEGR